MTTFTRRNAWNNDGTFNNTDILWYAKGVQVMQSRPIDNPTSWWFFAAIHGEYLLNPITVSKYLYLNWENILYISRVAQLDKVQPTKITDLYWNQCQHGTWFFLPWHRGYLVALEDILRDIIINELKGPASWSLPYWNYLNQSTERVESTIPTAFTIPNLPDGSANPLFVTERYGVQVVFGYGEYESNDRCQWDFKYSENENAWPSGNGNIGGYFYGGAENGFQHEARQFGDLEENPHNNVHGDIGGNKNNDPNGEMGLLGVPNTAALDPLFYLHHANIDRMWAAWNVTGKRENPTEDDWLKGPFLKGNPRFAMPLDLNGTPWYYTPADVQSTTSLKYKGNTYAYTYDDLSLTSYSKTPPDQSSINVLNRFIKLGVSIEEKNIQMSNRTNNELVGASHGSITLKGSETKTNVKLNTASWKSVSRSFLKASFPVIPDEVYLELEGVKGGSDTNFLSIYVNEKFVKSVSLFGLLSASIKDVSHASGGLNFKFNITNIVDELHLDGKIDVDSLNVHIKVKNIVTDESAITIDRIGVYRVGH